MIDAQSLNGPTGLGLSWAGILAAALVLAGSSSSAMAEGADQSTTSAGEATSLEEILVTARRRSENLQNVPLSITAITATQLKEASATGLEDISFLTAGLTYTSLGAQADAAPVIRGLSDTSGGLAASQNVSVFLDGIYIANSSAIDLSLGGVERVEVVKGPVSGLYGRNAFTGAINYVTAKPTQDWHTDDSVTLGNDGREVLNLGASGAIVRDLLAVRLAATYDHFDGTFHDPVSGQYGNGHKKKDILVSLLFTPDSHITISPVFYYGDDEFTDPIVVGYKQNCALGTANSYCGNLNNNQIGPYIAAPDGSGETGNTRHVTHAHIDAKFAYNWGSVDVLAGINAIDQATVYPFDATEYGSTYGLYPAGANNPFAGNPTVGTVLAENFFGFTGGENDHSVEVRYDTPDNKPLRVGIGGYYYEHTDTADNTFGIDGKNIPAGDVLNFIAQGYVTSAGQSQAPLNYARNSTRDKSGFLSGEYDILPTLTLSAAVRQTSEAQRTSVNLGPWQAATFNSTTSNSALTWKPTKELTFYVSGANGEKAGGFNNGAKGPLDASYAPETDVSYEMGVKSNLLDGHLRLVADVFHTTLDQLQVLGPPSTPGQIATVVKNFGSVTDNGFEIEADWVVGNGLTLKAGLGYSDPRFDSGSYDFNDGGACALIPACASSRLVTIKGLQAINLKGLAPPYESDWTFDTSIQYLRPLGVADLDWFVRGDYRYESKQYNTVADFAWYGPRNVVNLHAGVKNTTWGLTAFVLNASNDKTPISSLYNGLLNGFDAPPLGTFGVTWLPISTIPDGRTYGVRLDYHY